MIEDYFFIAFRNLLHRRLRSWLTMIGIFIGIATVISLISLGQGMKDAINKQFEMIGVDKIIIVPIGGTTGTNMGGSTLMEHDLDVVRRVNGIRDAAPMVYKTVVVNFNDKNKFTFASGLPTDKSGEVLYESGYSVVEGRKFRSGDRYKAIIGNLLANSDEMFGRKLKIGDKLRIKDKEFVVVGVLDKIGSKPDDSSLLIPLETAKELFETGDKLDMIFVKVHPDKDVSAVAEEIKREMRNDRNLKEGEENFEVQTSEQLMESFSVILSVLTWFLIGIASISLFVGGVGITNTMYTSVLERTREIGIMKAIGATNYDVLYIFLTESGLLGMAGGAIGIAIGLGLSNMVAFIARNLAGIDFIRASAPPYLILGALAFSFIIGSLAGSFPALQAARLNPVEALRK
ncbi:ABC transporter permease [Candidatus Woesearchaeota archaeon CG08_land_8_20_14_0_20_47_9]|nr:MAG: ABC transporter permease [Candidatus Woesearchaeota archaeon CG08_land_8_20_14_0_20_47_9]